jgi:hypothetical protein
MKETPGLRYSKEDVTKLHKELAPELALSLKDKELPSLALYARKLEPGFNRWMTKKQLKNQGLSKEEIDDFVNRGGIAMGPL